LTREIVIVVEGQTEEAFVAQVLQPYLGAADVFLTPIVVATSRSADGHAFRGGGKWHHYRTILQNLLSQRHWALVTTMVDFYAYPTDGPKCNCEGIHLQPACVLSHESAIAASFRYDGRFKPFLMLHEFETLVIAAGARSDNVLGDTQAASTFKSLVEAHDGNAECINNSPETAPSKRVIQTIKDYRKVRDSVAVLDGFLDTALESTPHFAQWVALLKSEGE
jgi:hypothetical protein